MATVASQIIFHPAVSQSQKLLATTLGRDKTYRAIQYFSRFLAWYHLTRGNKVEAARFSSLKSHLGVARKLMRLGKPMEHIQSALIAATKSSTYSAEQLTTVGRQLGYFGYLCYDTLVWAHAIKVISLQPETAQKVSKMSNRFWLTGIVFSIAHGIIKSSRLSKEAKAAKGGSAAWAEKDVGVIAEREAKARTIAIAKAANRQQLVQDVLDGCIPGTSLGFLNLNEGVLGIVGFITSVMALRKQWDAAGSEM